MTDNTTETRSTTELVSEEDLMRVINASSSLDEVVSVLFPNATAPEAIKARKQYVSLRATALRKIHPELKKFPRGRKPKVVAAVEAVAVETTPAPVAAAAVLEE